MKTAISIPDAVFRSAEKAARRLKVSRSQLYAAAVAAYVERYAAKDVTAALDRVYADPEASRLEPAIAAAQAKSIGRERW
jgi:metal-responsive CopG/Arc/MetJ family transcriptional regulator